MSIHIQNDQPDSTWHRRVAIALVTLLLAGCASRVPLPPPSPTPPPRPTQPAPTYPRPPTPPIETPAPPAPAPSGIAPSHALNPKAYRQDGARHLYNKYANQIYAGKMQPLLYAIGVINVTIDIRGQVEKIDWMRAPHHAPEVIRKIESLVREAAPYPAPVRLGKVVYTETWLWDKSNRWQLDTLTEGQY